MATEVWWSGVVSSKDPEVDILKEKSMHGLTHWFSLQRIFILAGLDLYGELQ